MGIDMNSVNFSLVMAGDMESIRWLRWLDAEIFPNDKPFVFEPAHWYIGWHDSEAVAYCGWKSYQFGKAYDSYTVGFNYRAGVLPKYRGQGLQKQMFKIREDDMKIHGLSIATSYTEVYSAASMCSLINMGYRPYEATDETALTGLDRYHKFVHWKKNL
jgi:GNAT superfamily N-acetyltransferase